METLEKKLNYAFIIPSWNEALIIENTIHTLFDFLNNKWIHKNKIWKIIIADNNSTDNTREIISSLQQSFGNKLEYFFIAKQGRGNALSQTIKKFYANIYFFSDADLPLEVNDISEFLKPLEEGTADIVVGRRKGKRPLKRIFVTFVLKIINKILFDLWIQDSQCGIQGCNDKAAEIFQKNCVQEGYFRYTEWIVKSKNRDLKIQEAPIHWIENRYPSRKSKVNLIKDTIASLKAVEKVFQELHPGYLRAIKFLFFLTIALMVIFFYLFFKKGFF